MHCKHPDGLTLPGNDALQVLYSQKLPFPHNGQLSRQPEPAKNYIGATVPKSKHVQNCKMR
jgi:hypothetical protein